MSRKGGEGVPADAAPYVAPPPAHSQTIFAWPAGGTFVEKIPVKYFFFFFFSYFLSLSAGYRRT